MRCYNCRKNFDYEKYYGICPKCGSFNQKETSPMLAQERPEKKGIGFLIFSIVFLLVGLFALIIGSVVFSTAQKPQLVPEAAGTKTFSHEAGESFAFQQTSLQVLEIKELADRQVLPGLEEGKRLIAVRVAGQSDGEYFDYNLLKAPYLETDGRYCTALFSYDFEPYGQMLGAYPVMEDTSLMSSASCDGWYGFVVDEEAETFRIWFEEYDWSEWDGGNHLGSHSVELALPAAGTELEGGGTDA